MNLRNYTCYNLQNDNFITFKNGYGWHKESLYKTGNSNYIYNKGDGDSYNRYDINLIYENRR